MRMQILLKDASWRLLGMSETGHYDCLIGEGIDPTFGLGCASALPKVGIEYNGEVHEVEAVEVVNQSISRVFEDCPRFFIRNVEGTITEVDQI